MKSSLSIEAPEMLDPASGRTSAESWFARQKAAPAEAWWMRYLERHPVHVSAITVFERVRGHALLARRCVVAVEPPGCGARPVGLSGGPWVRVAGGTRGGQHRDRNMRIAASTANAATACGSSVALLFFDFRLRQPGRVGALPIPGRTRTWSPFYRPPRSHSRSNFASFSATGRNLVSEGSPCS